MCNSTVVHTDLVHIDEREEFLHFLWSYQVLRRHVPVRAGHLVLHLVHPSGRRSDPNTAGLMKAYRLQREVGEILEMSTKKLN